MKFSFSSFLSTQRDFWRRLPRAVRFFLLLVVLLFALPRLAALWFDALWFSSLHLSDVFWRTVLWKGAIFLGVFLLSLGALWGAARGLRNAFAGLPLGGTLTRFENTPIQLHPQRWLQPLTLLFAFAWSLLCALNLSTQWPRFALYFASRGNAVSAWRDPIDGRDLNFYFFAWPLFSSLAGWLWSLALFALALAVVYGALALIARQGAAQMQRTRALATRTVSLALVPLLLVAGARVWLSRFGWMMAENATFSGPNFTQWHVALPWTNGIAALLLAGAAACALNAKTGHRRRVLIAALGLPLMAHFASKAHAAYVANFVVKPNELARETPSIENNIAATKHAFQLDAMRRETFAAKPDVASLRASQNQSTLRNVRLWDWKALRETLRQKQAVAKFYDFPDVDVDRYEIDGQTRQVMVAARELNVESLPPQSRNWVNERLIYTHGYGLVAVAAGAIDAEGKPSYLVSDVPLQSRAPSLKVARPQIYFGQLTDTTIYVNTAQREFDYPRENGGAFSSYAGADGVRIGSGLRRWALAYALGDLTKMPFSRDVRPDSRVLSHRNIIERAQKIAPFLSYDSDPYLVVGPRGHLVWMLDAFTVSSYFPMARSYEIGEENLNYVRNSVKIALDAYDGTVTFYAFDNSDPILAAWRKVHPQLFAEKSAMPKELRAHLRHPESLFRAQAEVYALYHATGAESFFARNDVWTIASVGGNTREIAPPMTSPPGVYQGAPYTTYAAPVTLSTQETIEPYFVLMRLPKESREEFVQMLPFTPAENPRLRAWMAARSDGEHYGSLLAYDFPESPTFDGPGQLRARIEKQPEIYKQISSTNQQRSNVMHGNILLIPMGEGVLYVQPLFLNSPQLAQPELRQVVVATQDKIAYAATYEQALQKLLGSAAPPLSTQKTAPSSSALSPQARRLIRRAADDLAAYQTLTAQGKYAAAGARLDALKRNLNALQNAR